MEEQELLDAVKNLNEEAWRLRNSAPTKAMSLVQKALALIIPDATLSRKSAEHLCMSATSLLTKSWIHYRLAEVGVAVSLAEQALTIFEELQDDANAARALNFLGNFFIKKSENQKAVSCFERSLSIYQDLKNVSAIAQVLNNLGIFYYNIGAYEKALNHLNESLPLRRQIGDKDGESSTLLNIGNVYYFLTDYEKAMSSYEQSLFLFQDLGNKRGESAAYNNIGNIYHELKDFGQAIEFNLKSVALEEELGNAFGVAASLDNVGRAHLESGNLDEALEFHQRSLAIRTDIQDEQGQSATLNSIGRIYRLRGNAERALQFHEQALSLKIKIQDKLGEVQSLLEASEDLKVLSRNEAREETLKNALAHCKALQLKKELAEVIRSLAEVYECKGNYAQALAQYREYSSMSNALFDEDSDKRLKNLQVAFKVEEAKKQAEIERIKNTELAHALAEAERQRGIAEEASRIKSEVLNVVAHDLQTPISAIVNFAWLLQKEGLAEKERRRVLQVEEIACEMLQKTVTLLAEAKPTNK
ncbi:MAG: tetratricopeptide repeat protein [Chloroherpetonaceae bacterium]